MTPAKDGAEAPESQAAPALAPRPTPRRASLSQARSRDTRRKLIRAAIELWGERGFDEAFDQTTTEEIARAAGVSKGTFYFHFRTKQDLVADMGWVTADAMIEEAEAAMARNERTVEIIDQLLEAVARRVGRSPRTAVAILAEEWMRETKLRHSTSHRRDFADVFESVFTYGRERGDLPRDANPHTVAALVQAATMDALADWASSNQSTEELRDVLLERAEIVLAGASVHYRR